jgi:hypothetical protein
MDNFLFRFPLRIILHSGTPLLGHASPDGVQKCLLVFTDDDLCDKFISDVSGEWLSAEDADELVVAVFDSATRFAEFCDSLDPKLTHLMIDPSAKEPRGGLLLTADNILPQFRAAEF